MTQKRKKRKKKNYQKKLPKVFTIHKRCRKEGRKRKKRGGGGNEKTNNEKQERQWRRGNGNKNKEHRRTKTKCQHRKINVSRRRKKGSAKKTEKTTTKESVTAWHHCRSRHNKKTQQFTKLTFSFPLNMFSLLPPDSPSLNRVVLRIGQRRGSPTTAKTTKTTIVDIGKRLLTRMKNCVEHFAHHQHFVLYFICIWINFIYGIFFALKNPSASQLYVFREQKGTQYILDMIAYR